MGLPRLFAQLPSVFAGDFEPEAPWLLLGESLAGFLADLPDERIATGIAPGVHLLGTRIVIGKGTRIAPGVVIEGPIWIGEDVEIRPGAYLRAGNWLGDQVVVGANTEIKHAILLPGSHAPHLNYVGDSILGAGTNLGAGTIRSNIRHDGCEIQIPDGEQKLATGMRKLGAILGDGVLIGHVLPLSRRGQHAGDHGLGHRRRRRSTNGSDQTDCTSFRRSCSRC